MTFIQTHLVEDIGHGHRLMVIGVNLRSVLIEFVQFSPKNWDKVAFRIDISI